MSQMIWRCDLTPQYEAYREEINQAIERVLRSGRYVLADNVAAFEKEFAAYIGCDYGIGVNSGTDALLMALWCFDLQPGDEVITTPFTAIPTYSAICHTGAKPVFVDIDPQTFLMDLQQVKQAITPRTRAVVPVHLFGNVVDIEELRQIVGPDIYILEDCAQSHGALLRERKAGSLGDISAFSFYPTKNLGAYGDGGMVLTNNPKFAEQVRLRRMYGMTSIYEFSVDGINTRLDEIQAAILRVKLQHLDTMNQRRRQLDKLYRQMLPTHDIQIPTVPADVEHVYHVYSVLCSKQRDQLVEYMTANNIQTNVYYPKPMTHQKAVRDRWGELPELPNAEYVSQHIIALPFYPEIPESTLSLVAEHIQKFFESAN